MKTLCALYCAQCNELLMDKTFVGAAAHNDAVEAELPNLRAVGTTASARTAREPLTTTFAPPPASQPLTSAPTP